MNIKTNDILDPKARLVARLSWMIKREDGTVAYWLREIDRLHGLGSPSADERARKLLAVKVEPAVRLGKLLAEELALIEG